jgi:hypothetical protein
MQVQVLLPDRVLIMNLVQKHHFLLFVEVFAKNNTKDNNTPK